MAQMMKNHYETPEEIRHQIWKELGRACQDRHHAWRTPVLATVGRDGAANARTVVLRAVDVAQQTLRIYTDRRSPKVSELVGQPQALFVFWSPRLNWQLRARVVVCSQTTGPEVEALWQRVAQSPAASDYLAAHAPGTPRLQVRDAAEPALLNNHFASLSAQVSEMDWLELSAGGHRRARLFGNTWEWLIP